MSEQHSDNVYSTGRSGPLSSGSHRAKHAAEGSEAYDFNQCLSTASSMFANKSPFGFRPGETLPRALWLSWEVAHVSPSLDFP